ncbi:AfsR/SARP family transcriptional regulator [Couchioplanes azureus]|uniref:AfsR/SARP family transcriptional regulator n=1 Tax=Couchioplanes caeruleus TaxID=56438 RepID=UPI00166F71EF|nr:AfsR/SARP family transcriptional regulator [Couchioplanes caeruleus]GGQ86328.1 hypothetical protein GCM10010166_65670 [Couchioplanes caeruleus subsp. azureus]
MRFNLLGPLGVVVDKSTVTPSSFNQRATLAFLLLHPNTAVSTRQLTKALWGDDPPRTARKMLQNAVAALRRLFAAHAVAGDGVALHTLAPGYLLHVEPLSIDLVRFHGLVERGRTSLVERDYAVASQHLRQALDLWRGPTLADLAEQRVDWPELKVTDDARLTAFEHYADAELAAGRHYAVVGELERLVAATDIPHEALCAQLMLALYRCGRRADALGVYRRARTELTEKRGVEPGRLMQQLERAILDHHPGLTLPSTRSEALTHRHFTPSAF